MQLQQFWEQLRKFLIWGRKWPKHGIMGAPAVQEVRGNFYL